MKSLIDKVFKKRKQDDKQLEEPIRTEDKATEAMVEAIIEEVKKEEVKKEEVVELKKPNHFPDCNCFKCIRWKRNAK
jgi:protoporphyrinogen oxidase